jgi:hypothetical protein
VRPVRLAQSRPGPVRKARSTVKARSTTRQAAVRKRAAPAKKSPGKGRAARKPAPRSRRRQPRADDPPGTRIESSSAPGASPRPSPGRSRSAREA